MDSALRLCRALVNDGITHVVAVAHQLGRYEGRNDSDCIRRAVSQVNAMLESEKIPLHVLPGGDIRIDERIPDLLEKDQIITVGDGGKYLLLELPSDVCIDPMRLVEMLKKKNVETILTHPERYRYLTKAPNHVLDWVRGGVYLQITAGSLLGQFGSSAMKAAWDWLQGGLVAIVASDAHHADHRPPCMSEAVAEISARLAPSIASRVCWENPRRVIEGQPIQPLS
jgi:protein-tyrosine phosphatase